MPWVVQIPDYPFTHKVMYLTKMRVSKHWVHVAEGVTTDSGPRKGTPTKDVVTLMILHDAIAPKVDEAHEVNKPSRYGPAGATRTRSLERIKNARVEIVTE